MDKKHFYLVFRYRAIMKDGSSVEIDLKPEECYYFGQQENSYLISAIRSQENIDINQLERIEKYFVPKETKVEIDVIIGL